MTEKETIQRNIEEFSRLQTYMLATEKDSNGYKLMKELAFLFITEKQAATSAFSASHSYLYEFHKLHV